MKKLSFFLLFAIVLTMCASCDKISSDSWIMGYASREIDVDDVLSDTYYVAGYKNGNIATGVLDNQCVKAVYLSAGNEELVLVSVDCIGLTSGQIEKIKDSLPRQFRDITHVVSTHTHAGVDTLGLWGEVAFDGKNDSFMEKLRALTAEAVNEAYENKKEGRLYYGYSQEGIEDLLYDSRLPSVYDPLIYQIRFEPFDKSAGVRIFNYAAHAESLRSDNSKISADFPRYLADAIKRETGDESVFLPGAIGGLIMTRRLTDDSGGEYPVEQNVKKTGELLASAALSIDNERELSPKLLFVSQKTDIPLDNTLFVAMGGLGILDNKIVAGENSEYGLAVRTSVSLLQLGDLSLVCIPGEIFPELAYGKGQLLGVSSTIDELVAGDFLVVGLFDDEIGYIVPPSDFLLNEEEPYLSSVEGSDENHYEETNSLGPLTAKLILDSVGALINKIK